MSAVRLFLLGAICGITNLQAQAVIYAVNATTVEGTSGRADFEGFKIDHELHFLDFEDVSLGALSTQLNAAEGVSFFSTISITGSAIGTPHEVVVSTAQGGRKIVGTPYTGGSDDGRVGYEIRFDNPQSVVGLQRLWTIGLGSTHFYNSNGTLLASYTNQSTVDFIGYLADYNNSSTWVSTVAIDTTNPANDRQVGYTDDIFFGAVMIPEPSTWGLLGVGLSLIWLIQRRKRSTHS